LLTTIPSRAGKAYLAAERRHTAIAKRSLQAGGHRFDPGTLHLTHVRARRFSTGREAVWQGALHERLWKAHTGWEMIKTSRVIGVIVLGLVLALALPEMNVNSTLSLFIAFAVMLVVVLVLAARQEGQRTKGVRERDEGRASGRGPH
jgi:hypothetical protein